LRDEGSTSASTLAHNEARFHFAALTFPMLLTDEQKQQVAAWIDAGAKLSEIQDRLDKELGVRMTYMDVRLLVDDLRLTPKETITEPEKPAVAEADAAAPAAAPESAPLGDELPAAGGGTGKVSVAVDQLARPGAMVSGKVTFSDGQSAEWYLDQYGRLGLVPGQQGYRPPQEDVAEFQMALDKELARMGL
jgi:hypothetical protein